MKVDGDDSSLHIRARGYVCACVRMCAHVCVFVRMRVCECRFECCDRVMFCFGSEFGAGRGAPCQGLQSSHRALALSLSREGRHGPVQVLPQ
jgi:hypothetical protein